MNRFLLLVLAVSIFAAPGFAADNAVKVNAEALNKIKLEVPQDPEQKKYLNITKPESFTLSDIGADFILVEIFSMYCPICQAEAPGVNQIFSAIEGSDLKKNVKVVGLGIGNTPFEVNVFRKKYDVKFPLFADDAFGLQKAFSEPVRTPTFVGVKRDGKELKIKSVHVGAIKDTNSFIKTMIKDQL